MSDEAVQGEAGFAIEAPSDERLQIDAFAARVAPMTLADRAQVHELTVSVQWPHRPDDLDLLIGLGRGYVARDQIGRPLGSAMHFPMGPDFATLGMMITPPRLQSQGGGRWLLNRVLRDCAGRDLRLNATRSGFRLYQSAGFIPVGLVYQHQGVVESVPGADTVPGVEVAPMGGDDRAAIGALDAAGFGADRSALLDALMPLSAGVVARAAGRPCGFAMMRAFGRGQVIGPVVAETEAVARLMVAGLLRGHAGGFVRMDVPEGHRALTGFLEAAGMRQFDSVTEMRIGPQRRARSGAQTFGLAGHSVG